MLIFKTFIKSVLILPLVLLTCSTPIRITRTPVETLSFLCISNVCLTAVLITCAHYFFWDVVSLPIFWWGLSSSVLAVFFVSFRQIYNREKNKRELLLKRAKNSPWVPYTEGGVSELVNIELKNGSVLWRVPGSCLDALKDEVRLWMPAPSKHVG